MYLILYHQKLEIKIILIAFYLEQNLSSELDFVLMNITDNLNVLNKFLLSVKFQFNLLRSVFINWSYLGNSTVNSVLFLTYFNGSTFPLYFLHIKMYFIKNIKGKIILFEMRLKRLFISFTL